MATTETDRPAAVQGEVRMLIDGELVEAASGKTFDNINPATEEVLGRSPTRRRRGHAARHRRRPRARSTRPTGRPNRAFRQQCLPPAPRGDRERAGSCCARSSSPRSAARSRSPTGRSSTRRSRTALPWPAEHHRPLRVGARAARSATRSAMRSRAQGRARSRPAWSARSCRGTTRSRCRSQKIGQALATGNTVILKPAPDTPWNATRLGRLVAEQTDIPAGVVNVVTSSDHLVGEELDDRARASTSSRSPAPPSTGKRIMEKGAADHEALVPRARRQVGRHRARRRRPRRRRSAWRCMRLRARRPGLRDADPHARAPRPATTRPSRSLTPRLRGLPLRRSQRRRQPQGPQVSAKQRERVLGYIEKGVAGGRARSSLGGGRPEQLDKGWFVQPTLLRRRHQRHDHRPRGDLRPGAHRHPVRRRRRRGAHRQRQPVRPRRVRDVRLRGAGRWRSAKQLRAGTVGVNGGVYYGADAPFGGYKASGFGRQNGIEGFEQYTEVKTIAVGVQPE